jgi:hypothetical protein
MRRGLLALIVVAAAALGSAQARELSYTDILGRWCGDSADYDFTPQALTVIFHAGNASKPLRVQRYEFSESWVMIWWERDGKLLSTAFAEFSADRSTMVQLANTSGDYGPRRVFRRCGP